VDVGIGDPEVQALLIGTGKALGIHTDGGLLVGLLPRPKAALELAPALQPSMQGRRDDRGAIVWSAGLQETVEHGALGLVWCMGRRDPGASPDATVAPDRGGRTRVRTRRHEDPSSSSLLEMRKTESFLIIWRVGRVCQAARSDG